MRVLQLLAPALIYLSVSTSAWPEELLGSPALKGSDFPRVIGGHLVTEGEYSIFVRDCKISIFIMEEPIRDQDHLLLSLQTEYFIRGAQQVGAPDLNYDQFLDRVRSACDGTPNLSLAQALSAAVEQSAN